MNKMYRAVKTDTGAMAQGAWLRPGETGGIMFEELTSKMLPNT